MHATLPDPATDRKPGRVRYGILLLIFAVTALNFGDRAALAVLAPLMKQDLALTPVQTGSMLSAFSIAYILGQIPGGMLLDRFGPRRIYAASILGWATSAFLMSMVPALSAFIGMVSALCAIRFMVGLVEAPAFPANAKMAAAWFPAKERGTASAFYNSAQYFAPVVFSPLVAWLGHAMGWRAVYAMLALLGLGMAAVWGRFARSPAEHKRVNAAEMALITQEEPMAGHGAAATFGLPSTLPLSSKLWLLLANRTLIGIYLGQYCVNVITYFFLTWFPLYLVQDRHMSLMQAGLTASIPALCGFLGGISGGLLSDRLLRMGFSLTIARKLPIVIGMTLAATLIGCNYVSAQWMVIALMSLAFFGKGLGAMGWAVIADTAPRELLGLSGGIFNMFGNLAGVVTPIIIGAIVARTGNFAGALLFVGLAAFGAVASYLLIVGRIERMTITLT